MKKHICDYRCSAFSHHDDEVKYPHGKRGLANASPETIKRVTRLGGKASKGGGRPKNAG